MIFMILKIYVSRGSVATVKVWLDI